MDSLLPTVSLSPEWGISTDVPVLRSKLHGHRGISSYDPQVVEYLPLDPPFYDYLVSCATSSQAQGIKDAFSRSEALHNPDDLRKIVFTVLPGHGVVIAEKWLAGKAPLQAIWEAMDLGQLCIERRIPQGRMEYVPGSNGSMILRVL